MLIFTIAQPPPLPRLWAVVPIRGRAFASTPRFVAGLRGSSPTWTGQPGPLLAAWHANLRARDFGDVFGAARVFAWNGAGVCPGLCDALAVLFAQKSLLGFPAHVPSAEDWPPL